MVFSCKCQFYVQPTAITSNNEHKQKILNSTFEIIITKNHAKYFFMKQTKYITLILIEKNRNFEQFELRDRLT